MLNTEGQEYERIKDRVLLPKIKLQHSRSQDFLLYIKMLIMKMFLTSRHTAHVHI